MSKQFNISFFIIALLFWSSSFIAQAPESMNYQAVIRNGSGDLVASQQVGLRIKILQGSASGSSVYEETYSPTTNAYGLVNLQLGTGTVQSGTFSSIDWGNGPYFVETAADVSGGTSYVTLSTTQFMSVPYALYAKNAGLDSAAVQAMIDAAGGSGGSSGGKSFAFPEGLHGTPITYAISSGNYTVPTGKRLYILNLQGGTSHTLNVNGFAINYYATNNTTDKTLGLPIILSAGDVLSGTDAVFNGFLVNSNANLSTVTHRLLGNSNYTVPAGKILYILNVNGGTLHNLYIDGTRVNHYLTNSTSGKTLNLPIIASAGEVITGTDGVFNGYVVDENFFESSSSGSSSSSGGGLASLSTPTVTTNAVTNITSNGGLFSGSVTGVSSSEIIEKGIVYSTSTGPNSSSDKIVFGSGTGTFDSIVGFNDGLDTIINHYGGSTVVFNGNNSGIYYHFLFPNTTYYVRSYAITENNLWYYGSEENFTTLSVGQSGQGGGIVFYDKGNNAGGWQYLEVASSNQGAVGWGCNNQLIGGTKSSLGSGSTNTNLIVNGCSDANFAAKICQDLISGGKSDWFLPSAFECAILILNTNPGTAYWSSTEYGATRAYYVSKSSNTNYSRIDLKSPANDDKTIQVNVRAIRKY